MVSYSTYIGEAGKTATIPLEGACDIDVVLRGCAPHCSILMRLRGNDFAHIKLLLEQNPLPGYKAISLLMTDGVNVMFDGDVELDSIDLSQEASANQIQALRPLVCR